MPRIRTFGLADTTGMVGHMDLDRLALTTEAISPRIPADRSATLDFIVAIFGRISTLESVGASFFWCCVCASGSLVDGRLAQKSLGLFLRRQVVCMHLQREDIRQPSMDWWTPGIFTWEERTPPVHLRTPLVVRSHEVLTRGPAIQLAGQSMVCQRLV
jgi:hypothetical protein